MRKGVFIQDITVERFKNASLEAVEELMVSGTMEDIKIPDRPHGEWKTVHLDHEAFGIRPKCVYCSECQQIAICETNFCPNCGASMQTTDENTQKHYGFRKKY